jgi:cytochrome c
MDSFELNKFAAATLITLLVIITGSLLADYLVHEDKLAKPVLIVEGTDAVFPDPKNTQETTLKPVAPLLASASAERGREIAKKCAQCHTFEKGEPNRIGPNLWGILGAKIAHATDFAYSANFKAKGGNWDYEKLNHFIYKPREYIEGTKMSFVGLQKPEDRADVIMFLHSLSDSPLPLPAVTPAPVAPATTAEKK